MPELTPKQIKNLERLAKIVDSGNLAVFEHLVEIEEKLEETLEAVDKKFEQLEEKVKPNLMEFMGQIKGKDGKTPVKGKDYFTPKDIKEISGSIKVPIVEKIIEKTEVIKEQPITIEKKIENPFLLEGKEIVEKINGLPLDDDKKIDATHIKNLPSVGGGNYFNRVGFQVLDDSSKVGTKTNELSFGSGLAVSIVNGRITVTSTGGSGYTKATPTGDVNGVNTTYTVTNEPVYVIADGATFFDGQGYTYSPLSIEMVNPPTQYIRYFY